MSKKIDITSLPTFYINLEVMKHRKESTEKILLENGFKNFQRFPGFNSRKKISGGKRMGCSISHINILKHIITNKIYPCLILEDDIEIFQFQKNFNVPENSDAMYLGISRYGHEQTYPAKLVISNLKEHYHKVHNMLTRHAVIHFNEDYDQHCVDVMERFLENPEKHHSGDISISKINPEYNVYCQNIPVFYQDDMPRRYLTKCSLYDIDYIDLDIDQNRGKII
jgi:hypothetical protein